MLRSHRLDLLGQEEGEVRFPENAPQFHGRNIVRPLIEVWAAHTETMVVMEIATPTRERMPTKFDANTSRFCSVVSPAALMESAAAAKRNELRDMNHDIR